MSTGNVAARSSNSTARSSGHTAAAPSLVLAIACPRCGAAVPSEGSDFCEYCSAHLYPGHCVFCLEAFIPGQARCRRCGLPPEGVVCGACNTFSRFDFCPNPECGAGLTPRAAEEIARLDEDPEVVEAFVELDEIGALLAAVESDAAIATPTVSQSQPPAEGGTGPLTPPLATAAAGTPEAPAATLSASKSSPRPSLAALRAVATSARSAEEKVRARELAQQAAQDALHAVSSRTFPTAQEARAAGTALQVALRCRVVTERLETIAWRCNRFSCEHPEPGGMSLCSDPSGGGVPIMRVITQVDDRSTEFTA